MSTENPCSPSQSCCPLCGGANQCAMAAGGAPESCWCMTAAPIAPTALAAVPEAQRGQVCICAACGSPQAQEPVPPAFAQRPPPAPI
ncbi:cysteine-rich CWC family protein [Acidovorax sp.]|uniref:cysteine-rich CWC family protein n=1 Tax=Acidovorax sp. TaxID=1872122 RepID=UPI002619AA1E|nr:cysteine-rich CWC family protein [Acidovorax sp.]